MEYRHYRTLADDMRDDAKPPDDKEHVHFHEHRGVPRHAHSHVHRVAKVEYHEHSFADDPPSE